MADTGGEPPACPHCNRAVARTTTVGPHTALVEPCGHQVRPAALSRESDDREAGEASADPVPTP